MNDNTLHAADLPHDITEEDLKAFFKGFNINYINISQNNQKTFAKICFENKESADKARKEFNLLPLKENFSGKNRYIRMCRYTSSKNSETDNSKNLLVKNLDKKMSPREFYELFSKYGELFNCKLELDFHGNSKGHGCVFYESVESANKAKEELNDKVHNECKLSIVEFIPGKSKLKKLSAQNNIYVKNFPSFFEESNLREIFNKYGEITSCTISRDTAGNSKGFGFVCFASPNSASLAFREINESKMAFEGMEPLYLSFAQKKEERYEQLKKMNITFEKSTLFFKLINLDKSITGPQILEYQIKMFIRTIMKCDYNPRDITVKFEFLSGLVNMKNSNDSDLFMAKYNEFCSANKSIFLVSVYQNKNERMMSKYYNNSNTSTYLDPLRMFSCFQNMSIVDNTLIPYYDIDPKTGKKIDHQPTQEFSEYNKDLQSVNNLSINSTMEEEITNQIYSYVLKTYPNEASKITGMIRDLGADEMKKLLGNKDNLNNVILDAYKVSFYYFLYIIPINTYFNYIQMLVHS